VADGPTACRVPLGRLTITVMDRVAGIGGFFFRARDPDSLNRWYAEHLGVPLPTGNYEDPGWFPDRGETVFTAFSPDSGEFGSPEKTWKINFRVSDLDAMVEQLRAAGIEVHPHEHGYPNGRFAELADPEGNRIQLWEPNEASIARGAVP
jgi:glyoxylase I family protein